MAQLSTDQEDRLQLFRRQVELLSDREAKNKLVQVYEQMLVQDTLYRQMIKHQWGMED